ncbi:MAG: hypothetical protein SFY56_14895 [Bacteroidota bacterium]|nr:hypothetical protein [Bacteroidota bacterium]
MKILFGILIALSVLSPIVPILYCIKKRSAFNNQLKALFLYIVVAIVVDVFSAVFNSFKINRLPLQLCFDIFELLIISYLYWLQFNNRVLKFTIVSFVGIYLISIVYFFLTHQNIENIINYADVIEASIIIILSLIFFFKVLADLEIPKLTAYPFFWFNSAFLLYFGTSFFLFLFNNNLRSFNETIVLFLNAIHLLMNICFNTILSIGLCKVKKI